MSDLLLTAFGPYADFAINPSDVLCRAIEHEWMSDHNLTYLPLPASYERAPAIAREAISIQSYDAVVMTGLAPLSTGIQVERRAINQANDPWADSDGQQRSEEVIAIHGPAYLHSTIPLTSFYEAAYKRDNRTVYSVDAGQYVCNHLLYQILTTGTTPAGFVHLPPYAGDDAVLRRAFMAGLVAVGDHLACL